METLYTYIREYIWWIVGFALFALFAGVWLTLAPTRLPTERLVVEEAPFEQVIEFTGAIVPQSRAELAFERQGRVVAIHADIGQTVGAGAALASLDSTSARADIAQQEALLRAEEAQLALIQRGARDEELALERATVRQREVARDEALAALTNSIKNSYAVAESAVYTTVDELFDNPDSAVPTLTYTSLERAADLRVENSRLEVSDMLERWDALLSTLGVRRPNIFESLLASAALANISSETESTQEALTVARTAASNMTLVRTYLQNAATYTNRLTPHSSLTQTTIASWQSAIATERTALNTTITALDTAREKLHATDQALRVAQQKLALLEAPATAEDIDLQEAKVAAQRARVASLHSELTKYTLRAPQYGTVTDRMLELGEIVAAHTPVFTLDSADHYEMDARVSELDVIMLAPGQSARVTLDPYGAAATFDAKITHIDPAESAADNGYGVTLAFTQADERLRPGMTANASIAITINEAALAVPSGYITERDDGAYVRVLSDNESVQERNITLGVQNTLGLIEVTDGLTAGDTLVPYER